MSLSLSTIFDDIMIPKKRSKSDTSSSQIKASQKLLKTHVRGNLDKALMVLRR